MGKFYVVISVHAKAYKLCRDDVRLVHSRSRITAPPLPSYREKRGQQATSE